MSKPESIVKSFGTVLRNVEKVEQQAQLFKTIVNFRNAKLPKELNGPQLWKSYLCPVKNQGSCGNCWAHSMTTQLADRFALLSLGAIKFNPSPYEITICSHNFSKNVENEWQNQDFLNKNQSEFLANRACNGNTLYDAADTLYTDGTTDMTCFPAQNASPKFDIDNTSDSRVLPSCSLLEGNQFDKCPNSKKAMRKYRALTAYNVAPTEYDIMQDIFKYGPVSSGFMMFPNFMEYDGKSIYRGPEGFEETIGGHAIVISGWGESTVKGKVIKFWWIKNSWGTDWGIGGYFRLERNLAKCELESNVMGLLPDIPGMSILDPALVPIETEEDLHVRMFTGHFVDPVTGYYTTAIQKIKRGELTGDLTPILPSHVTLPNYKQFQAGLIDSYVSKNKVTQRSVLPIAKRILNSRQVVHKGNRLNQSKSSYFRAILKSAASKTRALYVSSNSLNTLLLLLILLSIIYLIFINKSGTKLTK